MLQLLRTILWERHDQQGSELCQLWRQGEGWQLRGTILAIVEDRPVKIRYGVRYDHDWLTREVHVALGSGSREHPLHLRVEGDRWYDRGGLLEALAGCSDIDLAVTPATNTPAIRRLHLSTGESAEVRSAWLRFPGLTLQAMPQRYTRLGDHSYRYQGGSYETDLTVDDLGLVIEYEGGWSRVASSDEEREPGAW